MQIIVITTFGLDEYVAEALRAGAVGFLVKDSPPERIVEAVEAVARGDAVVGPEVTRRLIERFVAGSPARPRDHRLQVLTERERDVLLEIAAGHSNAEIAERLFLEESTVKGHVGRLLTKLDAKSRVQAVIFAYETGLVAPSGEGGAASQ